MKSGEKIIGILGGMGPEATADLFYRIIKATPVERDQDHIRVIIDSNSKIPDRTPAILGKGQNPLPLMIESGKNLEKTGVDFIIMPCNTAHYFYNDIQAALNTPVLHMIRLSAEYVSKNYNDFKKIGLLATDGTLASNLYTNEYSKFGMHIITPDEEQQIDVMDSIYKFIKKGDLKAGREMLNSVSQKLIDKGVEAVICGCTEVSLVLHDGDLSVPVFDPMQVLAEKAVKKALSW